MVSGRPGALEKETPSASSLEPHSDAVADAHYALPARSTVPLQIAPHRFQDIVRAVCATLRFGQRVVPTSTAPCTYSWMPDQEQLLDSARKHWADGPAPREHRPATTGFAHNSIGKGICTPPGRKKGLRASMIDGRWLVMQRQNAPQVGDDHVVTFSSADVISGR